MKKFKVAVALACAIIASSTIFAATVKADSASNINPDTTIIVPMGTGNDGGGAE